MTTPTRPLSSKIKKVHVVATPENAHPRMISAMVQSSPGPGKYLLPGSTGKEKHDPTRKKGPAFSFGVRHKQFSTMNYVTNSPGPVYFVMPKVTRQGFDGSPNYSLYSRQKTIDSVWKSPGPGDHWFFISFNCLFKAGVDRGGGGGGRGGEGEGGRGKGGRGKGGEGEG